MLPLQWYFNLLQSKRSPNHSQQLSASSTFAFFPKKQDYLFSQIQIISQVIDKVLDLCWSFPLTTAGCPPAEDQGLDLELKCSSSCCTFEYQRHRALCLHNLVGKAIKCLFFSARKHLRGFSYLIRNVDPVTVFDDSIFLPFSLHCRWTL